MLLGLLPYQPHAQAVIFGPVVSFPADIADEVAVDAYGGDTFVVKGVVCPETGNLAVGIALGVDVFVQVICVARRVDAEPEIIIWFDGVGAFPAVLVHERFGGIAGIVFCKLNQGLPFACGGESPACGGVCHGGLVCVQSAFGLEIALIVGEDQASLAAEPEVFGEPFRTTDTNGLVEFPVARVFEESVDDTCLGVEGLPDFKSPDGIEDEIATICVDIRENGNFDLFSDVFDGLVDSGGTIGAVLNELEVVFGKMELAIA